MIKVVVNQCNKQITEVSYATGISYGIRSSEWINTMLNCIDLIFLETFGILADAYMYVHAKLETKFTVDFDIISM